MRRRLRPLLLGAALAGALALPAVAGAQAPPEPGPAPPPGPPGEPAPPTPPTPPAPPTPGPPAPPAPDPVSEYISPSGDISLRTRARGGQIYLQLGAQARYFSTYRLCVFSPTRRRDCKVFALRRRGRTYGSIVRWQGTFPARGAGLYRVTWSADGRRLGPSLLFRIQAPSTVSTG